MARKPKRKPTEADLDNEDLEKDQHKGSQADITIEQHIMSLHEESLPHPLGMPSKEWLKEQFSTKSAAVRYLVSELCPKGPFAIKDIAKHLDMRYQHVRNVATSPLKRGPNEDWRPKTKPPEGSV